MVLAMTKRSQQAYDYNYIYALLINTNFGVMDGFVPNMMEQCPSLMKLKTKDPDLPMLHETLAGPHRDEFLEAMTFWTQTHPKRAMMHVPLNLK